MAARSAKRAYGLHPGSRWALRFLTGLVSISVVAGGMPVRAQDLPALPAEPPAPAAPGRERLIKLNFKDTPLDQILEFYGELTGRTMLKSPGINATITLRAQTQLTLDESLQALDSVLAMNNVVLVPMGDKFFKVVQPAMARQEAMPISRALPDEPFKEADQLVSQVISLQHIEGSEAQNIIQGLIHGYGKIQLLERTNSLLITDTGNNIQRILEILEFLDRPTEVKVETRIYELRYAEASKIAAKLNELIAESQQQTADDKPRVAPVQAVPAPPGVIRPRLPTAPTPTAAEVGATTAELAERGILVGKVKIVADDRTNILFILSRPENFSFFDKIITVLDRPVEAEFIVRVIALEYADAEVVAGILNEFIGAASSPEPAVAGRAPADAGDAADTTSRSQALRDFVTQRAQQRLREVTTGDEEATRIGRLSPQTRILADKRTNALMLMGKKGDILALQDIIDQLDIMLAQVLVEAVIMEIDLRDNISHGVDWLQRAFTVYNEETAGPGGGVKVNQPVFAFGGGQRVTGAGASFIDAGTVDRSTPLGGGLTYYSTFYDLNIDAIIQMIAGSSDARILSTPVILTTDNTEAKILVGEERPIVTTSSTTDAGTIRSSYEYRNIGINLTVTPRINPQRYVIMEVHQQADDVGGTVLIDGNEVPIITKREFQASIAMDSRETIILGGLVRTDRRKSRSKIPLLGDIPIFGALFRFDTRDDVRTELMVLMTPYVMMTPDEARAETTRLFNGSAAPKSGWIRGWTDSKLSTPPKDTVRRIDRPQKGRPKPGDDRITMPRISVPVATPPPPPEPADIPIARDAEPWSGPEDGEPAPDTLPPESTSPPPRRSRPRPGTSGDNVIKPAPVPADDDARKPVPL